MASEPSSVRVDVVLIFRRVRMELPSPRYHYEPPPTHHQVHAFTRDRCPCEPPDSTTDRQSQRPKSVTTPPAPRIPVLRRLIYDRPPYLDAACCEGLRVVKLPGGNNQTRIVPLVLHGRLRELTPLPHTLTSFSCNARLLAHTSGGTRLAPERSIAWPCIGEDVREVANSAVLPIALRGIRNSEKATSY